MTLSTYAESPDHKNGGVQHNELREPESAVTPRDTPERSYIRLARDDRLYYLPCVGGHGPDPCRRIHHPAGLRRGYIKHH